MKKITAAPDDALEHLNRKISRISLPEGIK